MTDVVGEALIKLKTDDSQVVSGAEQAGSKAGGKFKGSFLTGLKGLAGAIGPLIGVAAVIGGVKAAIGQAREAQKVGAATEAIIKATGGTANMTAGAVNDLAGALSKKVGVDDEAIQKGQNLILTFKNVANEAGRGNDVFNRATEAALDLSAAGFGSIEGASMQLGKALNDPLKGMAALSKSGVTFTDAQKKQISKMVEQNDLLGAQKVILGEVESQVGGTAAATRTAGDQASVAWGNVLEVIGTALLPVIDAMALLFANVVAPAITGTVEAISGLSGFVSENKDIFAALGVVLLGIVGYLVVANAATIAWTAAWLAYSAVVKVISAITRVWTAVQWAFNAAMNANPIGLAVLAIAALIAIIIIAWRRSETFRAIVMGAWNGIKAAVEAVVNWFKGPFARFFTTTLPNFFKNAWNTVKGGTVSAWNAIIGFFKAIPGKIMGAIMGFLRTYVNFWQRAFNLAAGAIRNGISVVLGFFRELPGRLLAIAGNLLSAGKRMGGAIIDGLMNGLRAAGGLVNDLMNSIKSAINSALNLPFTIKGPGPLPDFTIPSFARGTIATSPTLGLFGEDGAEAVVPLRRGAPMEPAVRAAMQDRFGGTDNRPNVTMTVIMPTGDPEAAALAVMDRLAAVGF